MWDGVRAKLPGKEINDIRLSGKEEGALSRNWIRGQHRKIWGKNIMPGPPVRALGGKPLVNFMHYGALIRVTFLWEWLQLLCRELPSRDLRKKKAGMIRGYNYTLGGQRWRLHRVVEVDLDMNRKIKETLKDTLKKDNFFGGGEGKMSLLWRTRWGWSWMWDVKPRRPRWPFHSYSHGPTV